MASKRKTLDQTAERFARGYWCAFRELDVIRLRQWERLHLTLPQLRILFNVARSPGITANELAANLGITVSTTSGLVAKVVERGLVKKGVGVEDRRQLPLELTEEGRRVIEQVAEIGDRFLEEIAEMLGPDLEKVTEALERVAEAAARARAAIDRPGDAA